MGSQTAVEKKVDVSFSDIRKCYVTRVETLNALLKVTVPISESIARLAELPWDSGSELVSVASNDFCHILNMFKQGLISGTEIEAWANALECREDISISSPVRRELLHELANPLLTHPLSDERVQFWLTQLNTENVSASAQP